MSYIFGDKSAPPRPSAPSAAIDPAALAAILAPVKTALDGMLAELVDLRKRVAALEAAAPKPAPAPKPKASRR